MQLARATQYLLNLADKMPDGGGALRIAVERLTAAPEDDMLIIMALGARVQQMENDSVDFANRVRMHNS